MDSAAHSLANGNTAHRLTAEQRAALRAAISDARHEGLRRKAHTHRVCSICAQLVHRSDFPGRDGHVCCLCLDLKGDEW